MKYGLMMFAADYAIRVDELAREAEARGFESLCLPEHTHIPTSRRSPWPGGAELPKEYWHTLDLFVALTAAAAVTTTLKLVTGICLLVERDPITTAKEVASLDLLSNGRVIFGIGGGWNAEEMENHGTDLQDALEAAARARRGDEEDLDRRRRRVPRRAGQLRSDLVVAEAGAETAPADPPRRPYGEDPGARRATTATAGCRSASAPVTCIARIAELRALAERKGRDPRTISVSVFGATARRRRHPPIQRRRRRARDLCPTVRAARHGATAARPLRRVRQRARRPGGLRACGHSGLEESLTTDHSPPLTA